MLSLKNNQTGRSMVEMLGVLAIIGVLSIGGITGYSMAMEKYNINKTVEAIIAIVRETQTVFINEKEYLKLGVYASDGSFGDENSIAAQILKKIDISSSIPLLLWYQKADNSYTGPDSSSYLYGFRVETSNIIETSLCEAFYSMDWSVLGPDYGGMMILAGSHVYEYKDRMTVTEAKEHCSKNIPKFGILINLSR